MSRSTKQQGTEEQIREERNRRAFEGWLARKAEERKREQVAKRNSVDPIEERERKEALASSAYQRWLSNKQLREKQKRKERRIEEGLATLEEQQRIDEKARAQTSFTSWKKRKDLERTLELEAQSNMKEVKLLTPTLAGYCSVWSCDEQLADYMLAKVQRDNST